MDRARMLNGKTKYLRRNQRAPQLVQREISYTSRPMDSKLRPLAFRDPYEGKPSRCNSPRWSNFLAAGKIERPCWIDCTWRIEWRKNHVRVETSRLHWRWGCGLCWSQWRPSGAIWWNLSQWTQRQRTTDFTGNWASISMISPCSKFEITEMDWTVIVNVKEEVKNLD